MATRGRLCALPRSDRCLALSTLPEPCNVPHRLRDRVAMRAAALRLLRKLTFGNKNYVVRKEIPHQFLAVAATVTAKGPCSGEYFISGTIRRPSGSRLR